MYNVWFVAFNTNVITKWVQITYDKGKEVPNF